MFVFVVSMIERCDPTEESPQAICIAPTRELAKQIFEVASGLSKFTSVSSFLVVPHEKFPRRFNQNIIIGTPGKIHDVVGKRQLDLSRVKIFILDEADSLVETQGFIEQMNLFKNLMPGNVQLCLFSATYSTQIANFVDTLVPHPKMHVYLKPEELKIEKMMQLYIDCGDRDNKFNILSKVYSDINLGQCLIFVGTIKIAHIIKEKMERLGQTVAVLYGKGMDLDIRDNHG